MKEPNMQLKSRNRLPASLAHLAAGALFIAGCTGASGTTTNAVAAPSTERQAATRPLSEPAAQSPANPAAGQTTFASDDDASKALLAAVAADNHDQVHQILGPEWKDLLTGDKVQDANAFKDFAAAAAEHNRLEKKDANTTILYIGKSDWPFPIPIVHDSEGKWFFDTDAGKAEILARHIGEDELGAIDVCRAYVRAQRAYFRMPHDDSDVLQYAQRILSKPSSQDGLYYPVAAGEKESPFGPLVADAEFEGYPAPADMAKHAPYHGYHFRILKEQGPAAPGGAYSYIINGHMVAGFAMVAFPDKYGASGIMTFIVNQRGKVYQKDLGENTAEQGGHMTQYNPDPSWALVQE
jgi:hypothetical protein